MWAGGRGRMSKEGGVASSGRGVAVSRRAACSIAVTFLPFRKEIWGPPSLALLPSRPATRIGHGRWTARTRWGGRILRREKRWPLGRSPLVGRRRPRSRNEKRPNYDARSRSRNPLICITSVAAARRTRRPSRIGSPSSRASDSATDRPTEQREIYETS